MKKKLVSVCIPTHNAAKFISLTLDSILNQSYQNIEIIIGDNASTDNTEEIIKQYLKKDNRIKYYKNEENLGYSNNCNKLISLSTGDYISIYHSDDIYDIFMIEKEVEVLEKNQQLGGVFTLAKFIDKNGKSLPDRVFPVESKGKSLSIVDLDEFIKNILIKGGSSFFCPTSMVRKEIYKEFEGYDNLLKYIEDQDMWARILTKYPMGIINEKLISYRIHDKQGSSHYLDINRSEISIIIRHIESFLKNYDLHEKYIKLIKYAKSVDLMILALYAFQLNDYNLFKKRIKESKEYYKLPFGLKKGILQRIPFDYLKWNLCKCIYKERK